MLILSSRLFLATPHELTVGEIASYFIRNKTFLAPWEPHRDDDYYKLSTMEDLVSTQKQQCEAKTAMHFYLCEKWRSEIIGTITFSSIVYGAFRSCFLGYRCSEDHQGQGLVTEALKPAIAYVFDKLELHRIEANVMPRNYASKRVLAKSGFEFEGVSPRYLKINGVWEDHEHHVLLNHRVE